MAGAGWNKIMERNSFKEQIILRLFISFAIAVVVWGAMSYFTSSLVPVLRQRQDTALNFLVLTKPAMLISYNPMLKKGVITNLTNEESNLPLEKLTKRLKIDTTPYIFIPLTKNRQVFWDNFKANLSSWQRKPYQVLDYLYTYIKMRLTKRTFISVGDFILISFELPNLRGVDFTVRETQKTKKQKIKVKQKTEPPQEQAIILSNKKQEEDEVLVVEVFNASDYNGLAAEVTRYLRTLNNEGIFKVDVINYTTAPERRNKTKIIATTKRLEVLKDLSKHLGLENKEIYYLEDKNAISEAKIYLGEDFKLPKPVK